MEDTINVHGGSSGYHPQIYEDHLTLLCVERDLDQTTISKDELEKVKKDAKKSACEEYLSCLSILVSESGRFQGIKRALDNQLLLDKDVYPTTMPQDLNIIENFKAEVGTTPKGCADSVDESGVAFAQAQSWAHIMVCHHCGVKGHGVNECPNLTHAQRKQFWEERNKAGREKSNTALKEVNTNDAIAEVVAVVPSEDDAARVKYERYQRLMSAMEEIDIGMFQVGHSDTGFAEEIILQNALVNSSHLTCTSSTWTVVRHINPHL